MSIHEPNKHNTVQLNKHDVSVEWFSGTGAGGQHRNKCMNSCRVIHNDTGICETRQGRSRESNLREAMIALERKLSNQQFSDQQKATSRDIKSQIGTGLRGEKMRTYRLQDNNVIDHRTNKKVRWSDVKKGKFDKLWK